MPMSSKRTATRILWEFWEFYKNVGNGRKQIVFRSYSRMGTLKLTRSGYHKKLRRFEADGLVKRCTGTQGYEFHITQKAKRLRRQAVTKILRSDGLATLIIFDVPEKKHNARDVLRRYLIRNGFTQLRESCLISPFQVSQNLKDLIRELELDNNVTIFSGAITPLI